MVLKLGRTSKFSSPRLRGLEVHFSCIRSHIGFTYSDFTVLNLDIEIVNLVSLGSHVLLLDFQSIVSELVCIGFYHGSGTSTSVVAR